VVVVGIAPTALAEYSIREKLAEQVVSDFETAFLSDSRGIELLTQCDSAMAHSDGTDMQSAITNKVLESFDWKTGTPYRAGNYIAIPVTVTKVDLEAINTEIQTAAPDALKALLKEINPAKLFNGEGEFLPDALTKAEQIAFDGILTDWDKFLYTREATIHLALSIEDSITEKQPVWKIVADEAFLDIVNYK